MTTIAWDGTTLAADRAAWAGGMKYRVLKVHKIKAPDGARYLVGCCGDAGFSQSLISWMNGGLHPGKYPNEENTTVAVVIDQMCRVWRLSSALVYTQVLEKVHACGGGQDFAIGALDAGATSVQAIQIALKRSDMAGLGVDWVSF